MNIHPKCHVSRLSVVSVTYLCERTEVLSVDFEAIAQLLFIAKSQ